VNARADRFPLLDSLRAIAALLVLVGHASVHAGALAEGSAVRQFAARLDVGVTVFFLLSGFLLYRPFVAARLAGEPMPDVRAYAWRRLLRIAPAYWIALTVVAVIFGLGYVFTAEGVATYYGFAQIYRPGTVVAGLTPAWSLCVEVTFYALLPIWALGMRRLGRPSARVELAAIAGLFAYGLLWKVALIDGQDPVHTGPSLIALPAFLDHFALGMGLAVLSVVYARRERRPAVIRLVERRPWTAWALALGAYLLCAYGTGLTGLFFEPMTPVQYLLRHELYALVGVGLLLPAIFGDPEHGLVRRILGWPILLWLGLVSYGIYLWHQPVLGKAAEWGLATQDVAHPYLVWPAVGIAGAVTLAAISYYAVERPALSLRTLVRPRRPLPAGEAISEPAPALPS
jgi:peptidoglycan/LPS O-acetylase OafA/YrhL